jgi:ammonia channel protein AmtB
MHYWVERRFKIDDAVGAVAVHGYAGFFGMVWAGFMLWGYPSSPNPEYAAINPLGNFIGALIMCGVLGFIPGFVIAKILKGFNMLRIPPEIEITGLDISFVETDRADEQAIIDAELEYVRNKA